MSLMADPEIVDLYVLRRFVTAPAAFVQMVVTLYESAPPRRMQTPGGRLMSSEMTNCGALGWVSDHAGYRYVTQDPLTGSAWPEMPEAFRDLAGRAALAAGFGIFEPDACLINCYRGPAQMGAHRDADERDFSQPIVSVSLGAPAYFLWYGAQRRGSPAKLWLESGDVVVWGRSARKGYHAVQRPQGEVRYNLTLRKAG
ncbi:MAG: alpha-ketoglutarate-dependent dioxygenase AlkB [Steroidobacteraceae bacterium]|jgi:alkylated DNA repair protein (DNA oxidative demethylase)|nr:alpha-ketoglutarate-dependent dioxygenase AlkB [Gammaproteobacteria bacterium]